MIDLPLWFLANAESDDPESPGVRLVMEARGPLKVVAFLFTSERRACLYLAGRPRLRCCVPVALEDGRQLRDFLDRLRRAGCTHVSMDAAWLDETTVPLDMIEEAARPSQE